MAVDWTSDQAVMNALWEFEPGPVHDRFERGYSLVVVGAGT